ncbi:predicted protein [Chaetomium globosum CBS 148.51]|uniref:Uncharacterized protein n=1 Tax=Chaetomium globosum (strain ATCC 6205 / CBS 148.51 / DSM 1962 / NBRC 6347 / NRRL 1970) TaxID=306901 RepID=Q2HDN2_CHAGB|nr:uncharacterized protein CHGG_01672 [Chaetomium globosum CBS 148.51]EAQ93437.1 predicted protein [Chaetomium globosum CBS 148.51]
MLTARAGMMQSSPCISVLADVVSPSLRLAVVPPPCINASSTMHTMHTMHMMHNKVWKPDDVRLAVMSSPMAEDGPEASRSAPVRAQSNPAITTQPSRQNGKDLDIRVNEVTRPCSCCHWANTP